MRLAVESLQTLGPHAPGDFSDTLYVSVIDSDITTNRVHCGDGQYRRDARRLAGSMASKPRRLQQVLTDCRDCSIVLHTP